MPANDRQVGGEHYKKGGEEHWDRAWRLKYDCFQYIITKWVERWKEKGGIDDLRKAHHAIEKYIEVVESYKNERAQPPVQAPDMDKVFTTLGRGAAIERRVEQIPIMEEKERRNLRHPLHDVKRHMVFVRRIPNSEIMYLYQCAMCSVGVEARNIVDAAEKHGECAGAGYVNQDRR